MSIFWGLWGSTHVTSTLFCFSYCVTHVLHNRQFEKPSIQNFEFVQQTLFKIIFRKYVSIVTIITPQIDVLDEVRVHGHAKRKWKVSSAVVTRWAQELYQRISGLLPRVLSTLPILKRTQKFSIVFCQAFGGLRPTGQLDSETVALMKRPRFDN